MKVCIIIPIKQSVRFPNKNSILAHYTCSWLTDEISKLREQHHITVIFAGDTSQIEYHSPDGITLDYSLGFSKRADVSMLDCPTTGGQRAVI